MRRQFPDCESSGAGKQHLIPELQLILPVNALTRKIGSMDRPK